MAKKKKNNKPKKQKEEQNVDLNQPWISMRKGIIIIAITSVVMGFILFVAGIMNMLWVLVLTLPSTAHPKAVAERALAPPS